MLCILLMAHLVQQDRKDQQAKLALPDRKVLREKPVPQDRLVPRARQVHKDLKAQQALKDQPELFKTVPTRATCITGTGAAGC